MQETQFQPLVGKILWSRTWQPTPVFLSGESHGQRSLAGFSPQGCKESDMTECARTRTHTHTYPRSFYRMLTGPDNFVDTQRSQLLLVWGLVPENPGKLSPQGAIISSEDS